MYLISEIFFFTFNEDFLPFRRKTRSLNFAIFYGCRTYWDLTCFLKAHFYEKYVPKLKNDLDIDQNHTALKFHEDIPPFRVKMRSLNFAMFVYDRPTYWDFDFFSTAYF